MARKLGSICCETEMLLLQFCLQDEDRQRLLAERDEPARGLAGCTALHRACHAEPDFARSLADRLDLAYLEHVLEVRELDVDVLHTRVLAWLAAPRRSELQGLLWALCSDERPGVHALGRRLAFEVSYLAHRSWMAALRSSSGPLREVV
jgi:hypothetical protein